MSSNYSPNYRPQQSPSPSAATPRKTSPWLWVLGGCGTLLIIAVVAVAAVGFFAYRKAKQAGFDPELMQKNPALASAKIAVSLNPDIELVSVDEDAGTLTIRDKKSGKKITVNTEDIKEGKITFEGDGEGEDGEVTFNSDGEAGAMEIKTEKGTVKLGSKVEMPGWVPVYPDVEMKGTSSVRSAEGSTGTVSFATTDSPEKVVRYYETKLKEQNFKVRLANATGNVGANQTGTSTAVGEDADEKRRVTVIASTPQNGETTVIVAFQEQ